MSTNNKTSSSISVNNEMLSNHTNNDYTEICIIKYLYVIAAAVCSIMAFVTATKMSVNIFELIFTVAIFTLFVCLFYKKNIHTSIVATVGLLIIIGNFIFKYKKIITGIKHIINDYLKTAEADLIFKNLTTADKSENVNTAFCFIGIIIAFGLCFTIFYRFSFMGTFCLTFPFLELVLFWGFVPDFIPFALLLCIWVISLCSQNCSSTKVKAKSKNTFVKHQDSNRFYSASEKSLFINGCEASLFCFLLTLTAISISVFICGFYNGRSEKIKLTRATIKNAFENFTIEDIPNYVNDVVSNLTSDLGGKTDSFDYKKLGKDGKIVYKDKTMLEIELQDLPYCDVLYLKGFTAGFYDNNSWKQLDEKLYDDNKKLFNSTNYGFQDYSNTLFNICLEYFNLENNNMTQIKIKDLSKSNNLLVPYYTDYSAINNSYSINDAYIRTSENEYELSFDCHQSSYPSIPCFKTYPLAMPMENYIEYEEFVYDNYLYFDDEIVRNTYNDIVRTLLKEIKLNYNSGELSSNLSSHYMYDIYSSLLSSFDYAKYDCKTDGFIDFYDYLGNDMTCISAISEVIQDYFEAEYTYTLSPGKTPFGKDFVQYFLEEQKKGYCTYFATAGTLLMRAMGIPARYADGYIAPKELFEEDENGVYHAQIKDKYAHAWCEVFINDIGWVPVEFTPGYDEDELGFSESTTTTKTNTTTTTQNTTTTTSLKTTTSKGALTEISSNQNETNPFTSKVADNHSGKKADYSKIIKTVITAFMIIFIILIVLFCWKTAYEKSRSKHDKLISDTNRNKAVIEIYRYFSLLLKSVGVIKSRYKTDFEDIEYIFDKGKNYLGDISKDELIKFIDIAVEADMSNNIITEESYAFATELYKKSVQSIYNSCKPIKKFALKYLEFLY